MKVLFAVSSESISDAIIKKYQKEYKEILSYKNVYYFNAILKEIQKDKTYDRIVISEDLEPFSNSNYDAIDKFIFEKLDNISDEAQDIDGNETSIILICTDRHTKGSSFLVKLFSIGIYNALLGSERSMDNVCKLINKPRVKKEAKINYKIDAEDANYNNKDEKEVSELEIQNILIHFKKLGKNTEKYAESFNSISTQYTDDQLKIIVNCLPINVKAVLEEECQKYQELMSVNGMMNKVSRDAMQTKDAQNKTGIKIDIIENKMNQTKMSGPIVIPSSVRTSKNKSPSAVRPMGNDLEISKDTNSEENAKVRKVVKSEPVNQVPPTSQTQQVMKEEVQPKQQVVQNTVQNQTQNKVQNQAEKVVQQQVAKQPESSTLKQQPPTKTPAMENKMRKVAQTTNSASMSSLKNTQQVVKKKPVMPFENSVKKIEAIQNDTDDDLILPGMNNDLGSDLPKLDNDELDDNISLPNLDEDIDGDVLPGLDDLGDDTLPGLDDAEDALLDLDDTGDDVLPGLDDAGDDTLPGLDDLGDDTLPGLDDLGDDVLPGLDDAGDDTLPGLDDLGDDVLPGLDNTGDDTLPGLDDLGDDTLPGLDDLGEDALPGLDDLGEDALPGLDDLGDDTLPGLDDAGEDALPGLDDLGDDTLPSLEESEEYTDEVSVPGLDELDDLDAPLGEDASNDLLPGIEGDDNSVEELLPNMEDLATENTENTEIESIKPKVDYSMSSLNSLLTKDKKIVTFLGTTKNGTSFLVNNLAALFSSLGINTAILDMTQNRNSYYIYTNNEEELRNIAFNSINKLQKGFAEGIKIDKNLSVYTALPNDGKDYSDAEPILSTLVQNHSLILIDCDFETDPSYFASCQEIYLVQSMDILTIQPLTAFLRDLKAKGVLESEKVRVVINKEINVKSLTTKAIIGGMSFYNDPSMSFMTELFNKDMVKACSIPFEDNVYSKYLDSMVNCKVSLSGYSKQFTNKLRNLGNMVYPLVSKSTYDGKAPVQQNYGKPGFTSSINNTLSQMKKKF